MATLAEDGFEISAVRAYVRSEVDPHHDSSTGGSTDLEETGVGEGITAADIEFTPGELLSGQRDHRVALDGAGAAFAREVDGRPGEYAADTTAPEARPG